VFSQAVTVSGPPGSSAVAAGSTQAATVAGEVLAAGGNAIDAVVAAGFVNPLCEPVLSSLAGGGFIQYEAPGEPPVLLDFFVNVPGLGGASSNPMIETVAVDFNGNATQTFHAGWGTVATPGALSGLIDAHARWGRLPLADVIAPAQHLARHGVQLDEVQVQFLRVVESVLNITEESTQLYGDAERSGMFTNHQYAALLSRLSTGSPAVAAFLADLSDVIRESGGIVTQEDVEAYRPILREPLQIVHQGASVWTNPPPSFGGPIVVSTLQRLGDSPSWADVVQHMAAATDAQRSLTDVARGTTHVSVIDADGGIAAFSISNGSGSGTVVDGVQLNNMLGEEDLNAAIREGGIGAIHELEPGARMGSMMAPTIARLADGTKLAIGTGGSERIRSALVTTLVRVIDHGMSLQEAIASPRIHVSNGVVDVEPGVDVEFAGWEVRRWPAPDLYFGGVHGVVRHPDGSVTAVADARRGGHVVIQA